VHVRRTDKSCGDKIYEKVFAKVQKLKKIKRIAGAPVYFASDNQEVPLDYQKELEHRQGRRFISFTYYPPQHEQRSALKASKHLQMVKEAERHSVGLEGLHLHDDLTPQEKHQTNMDAFVDLLLLATSDRLVISCGGYSKLAELLHQNPRTVLSLIGEELAPEETHIKQALHRLTKDFAEQATA
jgi:hypothetical protein